jgi:chromosome segregation protein
MHESDESHKLREKLEAEEKNMHSIRENIVRIDTEISSKNELIQHKASMLLALSKDIGDFDPNSMDKEIATMKRESVSVMKEIEDYFSETKECNKKIAEIDRQLLELKEKGSFLRVSISPALANPALKFIAELKSSGKVDGIPGLVGELLKFDQAYSNAVESAAGNRLLYVVVDNAETASKVITLLKKNDTGRATFIPIAEVKVSESRPVAGFEPLLKYVSFSNSVRRAIEFVFSDTTLVPKMADAKKNLGLGRMVTLEGEIFERSGVISGGRVASNILAGMHLKKLDEQLLQFKSEKESLINRLYSIREEESETRSKKSKIDLEIRSLEIEVQKQGEKKKEQEDLFKTKERLQSEINSVTDEIKSRHGEKERLGSALVALEKQISELNESLSKSEQKYKEISDASNKKRTDLTAKISSLKATVEGKMKELELKKREYYSTDERIKQLSKEKKDVVDNINDAKRKLNEQNSELSKSESEMEKYSKDIEALFKALNEFDEQLQGLGKSRGEVTIAIEKFNKEMNTVLVKKATLETRIQDLKAEYESYKDVPVDESLGKDELNLIIKECEGILSQLGDVNLASIEKYEEKKKEVEDVKQKIEKLSEERVAILQMMSEIEDRKKEAFFSTFYAVSDNFQRMFKHIDIGEGFLYLDNPNSPFDSGLFIKLKRYGREHTLDSLSGGENTLVALMFIFALQFFKPSPFYILDEVDAALDKENSKNLALLISEISKTGGTQFIIVSHNDSVMSNAHAVLGVAKVDGSSRIVGVKLEQLEQLAKGA